METPPIGRVLPAGSRPIGKRTRQAHQEILSAHIVGPYASVLIQEVINLMYTSDQSAQPMLDAMHIHPALSEVVQRAFGSLMSPKEYRHILGHYQLVAT